SIGWDGPMTAPGRSVMAGASAAAARKDAVGGRSRKLPIVSWARRNCSTRWRTRGSAPQTWSRYAARSSGGFWLAAKKIASRSSRLSVMGADSWEMAPLPLLYARNRGGAPHPAGDFLSLSGAASLPPSSQYNQVRAYNQ